MPDNKTEGKHELQLSGCASGRITGVKEVLAFDTEGIRLDTVCGRLTIRGKELHISQLSVETGCITLTGTVDSIQYARGTAARADGKSIWQRMFR